MREGGRLLLSYKYLRVIFRGSFVSSVCMSTEDLSAVKFDDWEYDASSARILKVMYDEGGSATASTLRANLPELDDNNVVNYRLRDKLEPGGYVERDGTKEVPGALPDAQVWSLTGQGVRWVETFGDSINCVAVSEGLDRIESMLGDFRTLRDDVEDDREKIENLHNNLTTKVSRLKSSVGEMEDALAGRARKEELADVRDDVEALEKTADELQTRYIEHDERLDSLESRMAEVESLESRMEESFERSDEKIEALYEQQQEILKRMDSMDSDDEDASESGLFSF